MIQKKHISKTLKKVRFGDFTSGKAYKDQGDPQHSLLGNPVHLPFGIPAGPLLNGKYIKAALDKGFDIATYKTVRTRQYPTSEWPNVLAIKVDGDLTLEQAKKGLVGSHNYIEPLAITNSFGVPSYKPSFWQADMSAAVKYAKSGQVVVGSFQATTSENGNVNDYVKDFVRAARLVKETGVRVLEVNLSCPNEGTAHLLCFDLERSQQIIEAIKNEIGNTPLIIKIAYFEEQAQLRKLVTLVGRTVDAIAAINTIPAKIYDKNGKQALPGNSNRLLSGVCGHPIKWAGIGMVKRLKSLREKLGMKFSIIGVGGVTIPQDYDDYKKAGADTVMSATGAMWNPFLAQEIKKAN